MLPLRDLATLGGLAFRDIDEAQSSVFQCMTWQLRDSGAILGAGREGARRARRNDLVLLAMLNDGWE
jgi:hypothetical protein